MHHSKATLLQETSRGEDRMVRRLVDMGNFKNWDEDSKKQNVTQMAEQPIQTVASKEQ